MPELPEVETVKSVLNSVVKNAKITNITVFEPKIIKTDFDKFIKTLVNATLLNVSRIGKYLIFHFDNKAVMVSHLRMEGKYIECLEDEPNTRFARIVFHLEDNRRLCYDDSRKFGTMELSNEDDYKSLASIKKLGPEPFVAELDYVYNSFRKTNRPIKEALLDQTIMTGLGNIYVDEALFLSKIHPLVPASSLTKEQTKLIIDKSIIVLNAAIKKGGSTIKSYRPGKGITGDFQSNINAYGRVYQKCHVCGTLMKKIFVAGRGTTFCPTCQRRPDVPVIIGITGMISAGKSTLGNYLRDKGCTVYDADKLVKNLYGDYNFIKELETKLSIDISSEKSYDRTKLINLISQKPSILKEINAIVHPIIKEQIVTYIKNGSGKVLFFEVPLIFSNRINEYFDYIIGVETSSALQKKYLLNRGGNIVASPDSEYLKNRIKLDKIIINDSKIEKIYEEINNFLISISLPLQ